MKVIFFALLVLGVNYTKAHSSSSLQGFVRSIHRFDSGSCAERQSAGYICVGCDLLGLCINRNGNWETIIVDTCDTLNGHVCNAVVGACTNVTGPCNPNLGAFICTSPGIFPDPFDCQVYHVCFHSGNNLISMDLECSDKTAFNPQTGDCSLEATPEFCNVYAWTCERPGDMGPWRMNANIFYICIAADSPSGRVLFPQLYRCPALQIFDGEQCVSVDGTTATTGTTAVTTTSTTSSGGEFRCPGPGLYQDTGSCRHYYYCDTSLQAQRVQCPEGSRFDPGASACVLGDC